MQHRTPARSVVIGLVGGIASGKSSVLSVLQEAGATIIDADKLGHKSYLPGTACFDELVKTFGDVIVGSDGLVNRKELGKLVYADKSALEKLNKIVWPAIRSLIELEMADLEIKLAVAEGGKPEMKNIIVLEAAIMIEAKWLDLVDEVWMLDTKRDIQKQRLMARNKITAELADTKLNAQMSTEDRAQYAHVTINNNSDVASLTATVKKEMQRMLLRYSKRSAFEVLDVVDEGSAVSTAKRGMIINFGLTTRASYIALKQASSGKFFVQKRSLLKDSGPGLLDPIPGGHCDAGETFLKCAVREIEEEMGINIDAQIKFVAEFSNFDGYGIVGEIFHATVDCEIADLNIDKEEVEEVIMLSAEEILALPSGEVLSDSILAFKKYTQHSVASM